MSKFENIATEGFHEYNNSSLKLLWDFEDHWL